MPQAQLANELLTETEEEMLFPNATIIFFIISFLVFIYLFNEWFLKPVGAVIAKRASTISGNLDAAKESRDNVRALTDEYEKRLAESREKAQNLINRAVTAAQSKRNKELSGIKEQARSRLDESRKELHIEKGVLLDALVTEEADLVKHIVGKVLGEKPMVDVNPQSVKKALEEAI